MTTAQAASVLVLVVLAGLGAGCRREPEPSVPAAERVDPQIVAALRQRALPLDGVEPGANLADLEKVEGRFASARLVVLGEASHGTRELFLLKHRLVRFLVERLGFTVFILEAGGPEADRLDEYVTTGRGSPEKALARLGYWTWETEEFLDLLRWMREHNRRAGDLPPLRFFGMDMQDPRLAIADVLAFLHTADPAGEVAARGAYGCLGSLPTLEQVTRLYQEYPKRDLGQQHACESAIAGVEARLTSLLAKTGKTREGERARAGARLVFQLERYLRVRVLRDRFMADNVSSILEEVRPAGKAVLWTHNGHAVNQPGALGGRLKKKLGAQAVLVGMTFHGGTFRAVEQGADDRYGDIRTLEAPELPAESWERHLHQVGDRTALFDLRPAPGLLPLPGSLSMRRIGASFAPGRPEASFTPVRLAEDFDWIAYVAETSPTRSCCRAGR